MPIFTKLHGLHTRLLSQRPASFSLGSWQQNIIFKGIKEKHDEKREREMRETECRGERQTETDERDGGGQKLNTQMLINANRQTDDVEDKSQDYSVSVSLRGV